MSYSDFGINFQSKERDENHFDRETNFSNYLLRGVANREADAGLKFKIVETGGRILKFQVQASNPTTTTESPSGDCQACRVDLEKEGIARGPIMSCKEWTFACVKRRRGALM